jgi:UDP-hydrolysing UDP-N-acetyl-D-glucosamine 2-epimerase
MRAITVRPELQLQVLATGTMVLERFGQPVRVVEEDGFQIEGEVYIEVEGSTPATMAKALGFGIIEFTSEFQRLKPDLVLLIGDRYEMLAAAVAAAYMNVCIVHLQGGEVSGSIDESARHAISKLSHFHFPSTERSARYLINMGERPDTILGIGCPSSDIAKGLERQIHPDIVNAFGSGVIIDFSRPFLLVVFHPTTTEYGNEREQMEEVLHALGTIKLQTILLWPNIDAGADHISKAIRIFRDRTDDEAWLRTLTNLKPEKYLKVLSNASCAIGNSSSFVRDASYFGTPIVLVGNRQNGRERDAHVMSVPPQAAEIERAVQHQMAHGRYPPSVLYGDGDVSARIANALVNLTPYIQKQLHYVNVSKKTDLL